MIKLVSQNPPISSTHKGTFPIFPYETVHIEGIIFSKFDDFYQISKANVENIINSINMSPQPWYIDNEMVWNPNQYVKDLS